jgi:hypothetical protein
MPPRQQDNNRRNCWSVPEGSGPGKKGSGLEPLGTDLIFLTRFLFRSASKENLLCPPRGAYSGESLRDFLVDDAADDLHVFDREGERNA